MLSLFCLEQAFDFSRFKRAEQTFIRKILAADPAEAALAAVNDRVAGRAFVLVPLDQGWPIKPIQGVGNVSQIECHVSGITPQREERLQQTQCLEPAPGVPYSG